MGLWRGGYLSYGRQRDRVAWRQGEGGNRGSLPNLPILYARAKGGYPHEVMGPSMRLRLTHEGMREGQAYHEVIAVPWGRAWVSCPARGKFYENGNPGSLE